MNHGFSEFTVVDQSKRRSLALPCRVSTRSDEASPDYHSIFGNLFASVSFGIGQADANGHPVPWQAFHAHSSGQAGPVAARLHPQQRSQLAASFRQAMESGRQWNGELCWRTRDGRLLVAQACVAQVKDPCDRVTGYTVCIFDLSEQAQRHKQVVQSEERYRLAMEAAGAGIWDFDVAANHCYLSPACFELLGYRHAQAQTTLEVWANIIHPDFVEAARRLQSECVIGCTESFELELRLKTNEGKWRWFRCKGKATRRDASGRALRLAGTLTDINEAKMMEHLLRMEHDLLNLITSTSPVGIMFIETDGRIAFANPRAEQIIGIARQEMTQGGASPVEKMVEYLQDSEEMPPATLADALKTGANLANACYVFEKSDEASRLLSISTAPFLDRESQVAGTVVTLQDVTEHKAAEEAIRRLNDELDRRVIERTAQLDAAKREIESFSYSVSHDLRAPLRHINSYSTILVEEYGESLSPDARNYLERICTASSRMGRLIDDLLTLTRVGRAEMKRESFSISRMATEVADMLDDGSAPPITFTVQQDLAAFGDSLLVRLVLQNLMGNSVKYASRNPSPEVEFGQTQVAGKPAFFVKDNGVGFDMAYSDKLFEPFQRLHGSEFEGTGIGLATVRRIVERHGGTVWAEGKVGEGATFYFTLPHRSRARSR